MKTYTRKQPYLDKKDAYAEKQSRSQFRRAKRRIELGVAKPNDHEIVKTLRLTLGYGGNNNAR